MISVQAAVVPKVKVLIVAASIGSLKVALTVPVRYTPMLPSVGLTAVTVGGVLSPVLPVVKLHTWLPASALPARSVAAVVMVAVNTLLFASVAGVDGVKVAVLTPTE